MTTIHSFNSSQQTFKWPRVPDPGREVTVVQHTHVIWAIRDRLGQGEVVLRKQSPWGAESLRESQGMGLKEQLLSKEMGKSREGLA